MQAINAWFTWDNDLIKNRVFWVKFHRGDYIIALHNGHT